MKRLSPVCLDFRIVRVVVQHEELNLIVVNRPVDNLEDRFAGQPLNFTCQRSAGLTQDFIRW